MATLKDDAEATLSVLLTDARTRDLDKGMPGAPAGLAKLIDAVSNVHSNASYEEREARREARDAAREDAKSE